MQNGLKNTIEALRAANEEVSGRDDEVKRLIQHFEERIASTE